MASGSSLRHRNVLRTKFDEGTTASIAGQQDVLPFWILQPFSQNQRLSEGIPKSGEFGEYVRVRLIVSLVPVLWANSPDAGRSSKSRWNETEVSSALIVFAFRRKPKSASLPDCLRP